MELVQPAEISGKIMTLIDQAKEEVIIVSPYNKFTNWKKFTQRVDKAIGRGVSFKWYIRKNVENNIEPIRGLGIEPIEIENLHCKIYLNEKNAIVTSMNLHEYSDSSSIDIGYWITEKDKLKELNDFIDVYINCHLQNQKEELNQINHGNFESSADFISLMTNHLIKYGFDKSQINYYVNRSGPVIHIERFKENFDLIFEAKGGYYRIDLRINYPYSEKNRIYLQLKKREDELNQIIGHRIDFGSQMKRLKLDLMIFENYNYESWSHREYQILKPVMKKVISTYESAIINVLIELYPN